MTGSRERVQTMLADGWSFAGLYAVTASGPVRIVFARADGTTHVESLDASGGAVVSIVDIVPAAAWDEREAHDLYGIRFDGHDPVRPLVDHDLELSSWTVAVRGEDAYQVAVGPIHAGVIESGHFRFHLVGEKVVHLDARLFYKHRGLERAAEGASLDEGARFVARACAACAVTNGVAYAQAVEQALGLQAVARARTSANRPPRARACLEPSQRHLRGLRRNGSRRGSAALRGPDGARQTAEREPHGPPLPLRKRGRRGKPARARRERDCSAPGTSSASCAPKRPPAGGSSSSTGPSRIACPESASCVHGMHVVSARRARRLGLPGSPRMQERLAPVSRTTTSARSTPSRTLGDVRARLEQRQLELEQSFDLLETLLDRPIEPTSARRTGEERRLGAARVESPRGATLCVVERDGDRIARVHLRTGSYANWPVVAFAAAGNMLPDFPLINKSFELCYACADR